MEVTAIVHAIWPETAGRPVQLPGFARGQAWRRYTVSSKAQHAKRQCAEQVWKLTHALEDLGEHDLKGMISALEDDCHESGEGTEICGRGSRRSPSGSCAAQSAALLTRHLVCLGRGHDP